MPKTAGASLETGKVLGSRNELRRCRGSARSHSALRSDGAVGLQADFEIPGMGSKT